MIEFIDNFHFLRPWCLLFLFLPIGLYLKNIGVKSYTSSWENICDKNLLKFLLVSDSNSKRISMKKYIYTGIIAAAIGAAGPSWKKTEVPTFVVENPTMFVLSMARDMQLTDVTPSRLERAKFMISDIASSLNDGPFGLEVYSQEPYIITPLTDDVKIVKSLLPQIKPDIVPDHGDRLDRAIELAVKRFKAAGYTNGNIILFASDVGQQLETAINEINKAQKLGYVVHIVDTSFLANDKMKMLAEKGNGIYLSVRETSVKKLIDNITQKNQEKIALSQNLRAIYSDYGYYLVFVVLICLLPFFRRGLLVAVLYLSFISNAEASFFLNDNQEGLKLFKQEQYDKALIKFKDPVWRGISLYKQDKAEEALKEFAKSESDATFYNSGVILTKMCEYEKALAAFNKALQINPANSDAKYNKKVLDDLFEKAKEDPSVLNCDDQKNQQQNQDNNKQQDNKQNQQGQDNQNQDQNNNQNDGENGKDDNQQDGQNENDKQDESNQNNQDENKDSSTDDKNNQNEQNSQQNQKNEGNQDKQEQKDSEKDSSADNQQNSENTDESSKQENSQSGKGNQNNSQEQNGNENNSAPSDENVDDKNAPEEKGNTPAEANKDSGDEQKSKNEKGQDDNATEMQEEEVESQIMNMKKGDENTKYDEEALAMQRRYREIPEDPGGLLREFIKKEYMKDRYHD